MRHRLAWLATLTMLPARALADAPNDAWQPPAQTTERYNEDWSILADPANRTGRWPDDLKYVPLDASGTDYLTTGAELRVRSESYRGNWSNPAAPDDGYVWIRGTPYADLHVGPVRTFVQPILAYAVGVRPAPGPIDQTRLDLLQGFADVEVALDGSTTLRLRAGREMIGLGTERLVGTRYGPNVPLAFDGGRAILHRGRLTLNGFYVLPVEPGPKSFDDSSSRRRALWGIYATRTFGPAGVDLYYLGYRNDAARFEDGSGRELRQTIGMRLFGKTPTWHWNLEAMKQFGRFSNGSIDAWSVAAEFGRAFPQTPLRPNLTVRFNVASGDKRSGDHTLQTFNALFPKGKYFGELSPIGPYNLVNLQPVASVEAGKSVSIGLMAAAYWRQSTADGVYDIPGHLLRASDGSKARFVGKEIEGTVEWRATPELTFEASLSFFGAGRFIRETGPARGIRMIGLETNFRF